MLQQSTHAGVAPNWQAIHLKSWWRLTAANCSAQANSDSNSGVHTQAQDLANANTCLINLSRLRVTTLCYSPSSTGTAAATVHALIPANSRVVLKRLQFACETFSRLNDSIEQHPPARLRVTIPCCSPSSTGTAAAVHAYTVASSIVQSQRRPRRRQTGSQTRST
jgi:hypothetical protein